MTKTLSVVHRESPLAHKVKQSIVKVVKGRDLNFGAVGNGSCATNNDLARYPYSPDLTPADFCVGRSLGLDRSMKLLR